MFKDVIVDALKDQPPVPFRVPRGVRLVRVNPESGRLAEFGDRKAIWEAFLPGTEPGAEGEPVAILGGNEAQLGAVPGETGLNPDSETFLDPANESFGFGPGTQPRPGAAAPTTPGTRHPPSPPRTPGTSTTLGTGGLY
ncbi:hypothetical protein CCP1ISM_190011 [Azospirillaceae bacterium]